MRNTSFGVTCLVLLLALGLQAQTSQTFEVASIRRNLTSNQQGSGLAGLRPGGRFIAIGTTLRRLVSGAYDNPQVFGGPEWMDTDRFDVDARADGERPPAGTVRMGRALPAARF